jgi:DNA-binding winged helix-turn-helix (wHTH) protein
VRKIGQFRLDTRNQCVWNGQKAVTLSAKGFEVLDFLSSKPGQLVTHDELLDAVWPDTHVQPEVLKVYIFELRRALGDTAPTRKYIETVHRRGYRFLAETTEEVESSQGESGLDHGFLDRGSELGQIEEYIRVASGKKRQTLFIRGETGIGKSALLEEALALVSREPASWAMHCRCTPDTGGTEPFSPLLDALNRVINGDRQHPLVTIFRQTAPCWLVQFPNLLDAHEYESLKRDLAGTTSQRMSREFCAAMDLACADHLCVIAFDDLQWADPSTVGLVESLAVREVPACLLILGAYRSSRAKEQLQLRQAVAGLQRQHLAKVMNLGPLPERALKIYVDLRFPDGAFNDNLVEKIYQVSGGVPLFFISCIEYLQSQLSLLDAPETWITTRESLRFANSLPETLRELMDLRLSQLPAEEQLVLEGASLVGLEFSVWLAASAVEVEESQAEDICNRLAREGVWLLPAGFDDTNPLTISARFHFVHNLLRDALYERQTAAERMKRHIRVARAMEAQLGERAGESASDLAWHFEAGQDYSREIHYLRQAAKNAYRMFSEAEAEALLRRALDAAETLPPPEKGLAEIDILSQLGELYLAGGNFKRSAHAWEELVSRAINSNQIEAAALALLNAVFPFSWAQVKSLRSASEKVLRLSADITNRVSRAKVAVSALVAHAMARGWRAADSAECRKALETVISEAAPVEAATARISYVWFQMRESAYRDAIVAIQEALPVVSEANRSADRFRGEFGLAMALFHTGDWGRLRQFLNTIILSATKHGNEAAESLFTYLLAWLHVECGAHDLAIDLCRHAQRLDERSGSAIGPVLGNAIHGLAELALEQVDAAIPRFESVRKSTGGGFDLWFVISQIGTVESLLSRGNFAESRGAAKTLLELLDGFPEKTWTALALRSCARSAAANSDPKRAAELIDKALDLIRESDLPLAFWRVSITAAEVYETADDIAKSRASKKAAATSAHSLADSLDPGDTLRLLFAEQLRRLTREFTPAAFDLTN